MENVPIRFGPLVQSVGSCALPLGYATDALNCDFDEAGAAKRRLGYTRRLGVEFGGRVALAVEQQDADGTKVVLTIDEDGVNRT